jgi:HD-GYP domain-containing protein (c-di-GMP phosphodiesterase class II)
MVVAEKQFKQASLLKDREGLASLAPVIADTEDYSARYSKLIWSGSPDDPGDPGLLLRQDLYVDIFIETGVQLERVTRKQGIEEEKVRSLVARVVDEFMKDAQNDLVLLTQTLSLGPLIMTHLINDLILVLGFARSQGFGREDLLRLGLCAYLHDIGMVDFMDKLNFPARLSSREFVEIKQHPLRSLDIGSGILDDEMREAILDVHERENGQGYPRGKKAGEISPLAKIISVCDVYEALSHPRPFRREHSPFDAIKMVIQMKGHLIDEKVIKDLINFISIFPVGSLVRLNTGETALVTRSNWGMPTKSVVKVFLTPDMRPARNQRSVDLSRNNLVHIHEPLGITEQHKALQVLFP